MPRSRCAATVADLERIALRQRVMRDVSAIDTSTPLFGQRLAMPVALAPVGLSGLNARRGEVQAARARRPPACRSACRRSPRVRSTKWRAPCRSRSGSSST
jgi:L-lactate dehydrogenase (cytochrome)